MGAPIIRLVYPPELLRVPVLNHLIRKYDVTVNIIRAQVGKEAGWVEMQISGDDEVVEDALTWLREKGIYVQYVENNLEE